MQYKYEIVDRSGKVLAHGNIEAKDEGDAIRGLAILYKYEPIGDGWYTTIGGTEIEIQVYS